MNKSTKTIIIAISIFLIVYMNSVKAQYAEYVVEWGFVGGRTGGWAINAGDSGNVSISGGEIQYSWAAIRGGFDSISLHAYSEDALVITGTMEFTGTGFESWSGLRYGVFYSDSAGSVEYSDTDSARWSGTEDHHSGYLFIPKSGTNDPAVWLYTGPGTHGAVVDWRWLSTYGPNSYSLDESNQAPPRAVATAGVYDFAISIQLTTPETIEIRFYLRKKDDSYFFGGISTDTHSPLATTKFNCVCFAVSNLENANPNLTAFHLRDVRVGLGDPLTNGHRRLPYYINDWGFIGNRFGGWTLKPGTLVGNVTISGNVPNTGWSAVRGGFVESIQPQSDYALVVTGQVEFVGGGFETGNSLRFGVFYSDSAGSIITTPVDSIRWSGLETHHSGYLFIPPSGTNAPANWEGINQQGTVGTVVDDTWFSTAGVNDYVLGNNLQQPANAIGRAGLYDFCISIVPRDNGAKVVNYYLIEVGVPVGYYFGGSVIDNDLTYVNNKFNCVAFALDSGNTTTAIHLYDVLVDLETAPVSVETVKNISPTYSLSQNYPNPFNPTTQIEYSVPQSGHILLKVYNLLGQEVATLFEGVRQVGNYSATFDGSELAGGVYLYRLKAENFSETRKLTLLK